MKVSGHPFLKVRGLGDAAAAVFKPAAKVIDAVIGTNLQNCVTCAERQERWNEAVPFNKSDDHKNDESH
jgi:hypothetical protein